MQIVANNLKQLHYRIDQRGDKLKFPVIANIETGSIRSLLQNALQHKHYAEMAKFHGWTPKYAKAWCKLSYGLPILIPRMPVFKALQGLVYEQQIEFIDSIRVTSLFIRMEAKEYTDIMMFDQAQEGLKLTDPDDQLLREWEKLYKRLESRGEL